LTGGNAIAEALTVGKYRPKSVQICESIVRAMIVEVRLGDGC